jgi:hypothetical protein
VCVVGLVVDSVCSSVSSGSSSPLADRIAVRATGMSIAGLLPVESVHLAHCHWHPVGQGHWMKLNCWNHDNCYLVVPKRW